MHKSTPVLYALFSKVLVIKKGLLFPTIKSLKRFTKIDIGQLNNAQMKSRSFSEGMSIPIKTFCT